jgi:hypothetical protein
LHVSPNSQGIRVAPHELGMLVAPVPLEFVTGHAIAATEREHELDHSASRR